MQRAEAIAAVEHAAERRAGEWAAYEAGRLFQYGPREFNEWLNLGSIRAPKFLVVRDRRIDLFRAPHVAPAPASCPSKAWLYDRNLKAWANVGSSAITKPKSWMASLYRCCLNST